MDEGEDWKTLAGYVETRRTVHALSRRQVAQRGGPSDYTLARIERGDPGPYRPKTILQLENALEMRPGLVGKILARTATDAELAERWVAADSDGLTRTRIAHDGRVMGEILPAVPSGDTVTRLAVELLGALVARPSRTRIEQDLAEHLHRYVGGRIV